MESAGDGEPVGSVTIDQARAELPLWAVRLAREVARTCRSEGVYEIRLTVPWRGGADVRVELARVEVIRELAFGRRAD